VSITSNVRELQDKRKNGQDRPWDEYQLGVKKLAKSYRRIGSNKFYRVKDCGKFLKFNECPEGHEKKLIEARFCKVRLCPMCSARRSTLIFQNLISVVHEAKERDNYQFLFLTLTAKTVTADKLNEELTKYFNAWKLLAKRRPFQRSIEGWFRSLEITRDTDRVITRARYYKALKHYKKLGLKPGDPNPTYDHYHPHFHCLLAVKPSYFGKNYIKKDIWMQWWKESLDLDYEPIVDIRRVKPQKEGQDETGAVMELSKYTTKSSDYLVANDQVSQDKAVETLDDALHGRRLVAYGGIFFKIRKELKQMDEEKHDLIKVGEDDGEGCNCSVCNAIYQEVSYRWVVGLSKYINVEDLDERGRLIDRETGEIIE
jgi:plasmid rolling circle replication initiator protein Rep